MPKVGQRQIEVMHGDCVELVPTLGEFDFVFADPPFNIGQAYNGYNDDRQDYAIWMERWLEATWGACRGILALHGPDDLAFAYNDFMKQFSHFRIAWINWHYRFGQCGRSNWIDARCHCLIYSKTEKYTWNPEAVLVDSDRVAYGDKRIHETENGGKRLPGTIWGIPGDGIYWGRIQGNNEERRAGHPNQLPEVYLERLIRAYTNPGDRALDPFGGSGTTAVVCQALGRRCVTIDISGANCESIEERLRKGAVRLSN